MQLIDRLRARRRDERGAFAILFTVMAGMLLTVAALGTDLGNAISRHTDTQNQADFAAYDAAQELNTSVRVGMTVSDDVLTAVREALNNNQPVDDNSPCWRTKTCVTDNDQLIDTNGDGTRNLENGDVSVTDLGLRVTAPLARVDFGFANVFGVSGRSVHADATVNLFTAGPRVLPMFAVSGCDWGRQTLTDPAGPHADPVIPTLALGSQTNNNKLVDDGVVLKDSTGATVTSLTLSSTGNSLTVNGSKWSNLRKFGFFLSDDTDPSNIKDQPTFWLASDTSKTALAVPYTKNSGATLGLNVPDAVAATEGLWYLRAWDGTNWSGADEAQPIRVGETVLECAAGSDAGNFGTLKLPRSGTPSSNDIPLNIATGLQDPLNLVVHQYAIDNSTDGKCVDGENGAVESTGTGTTPLVADTNCVDTDTGLTAEVATDGLITVDTGSGAGGGLLASKPTHEGCAPDGSSSERTVHISGHDYALNNDTLSCFLLDGKTLAEVESTSYSEADGPAFSEDLLKSPRFAYVPILKVQPLGGGDRYSIIDFRPAFITDETATTAATDVNGVRVTTNKVDQLKVFFFSIWAVPHDGDVPLIDYLGVGHKVAHLVD